jgi:hypothetical protein
VKPSTASLHTEIDGIAAVVTELARIRGLAIPGCATGAQQLSPPPGPRLRARRELRPKGATAT